MQKRSNTRAIIAAALAIDDDVLVALLEMYRVGAGIVPRFQNLLHDRREFVRFAVRQVEIDVDAIGALPRLYGCGLDACNSYLKLVNPATVIQVEFKLLTPRARAEEDGSRRHLALRSLESSKAASPGATRPSGAM